jgi:hypothetical protein
MNSIPLSFISLSIVLRIMSLNKMTLIISIVSIMTKHFCYAPVFYAFVNTIPLSVILLSIVLRIMSLNKMTLIISIVSIMTKYFYCVPIFNYSSKCHLTMSFY